MTEKGKDKIITVSASFITSIIVVLISFGLSGSRVDEENLNKRIDSKVEIKTYEEHCTESKMKAIDYENRLRDIERTNSTIMNILTEIKTDVKWMRLDYEKTKK